MYLDYNLLIISNCILKNKQKEMKNHYKVLISNKESKSKQITCTGSLSKKNSNAYAHYHILYGTNYLLCTLTVSVEGIKSSNIFIPQSPMHGFSTSGLLKSISLCHYTLELFSLRSYCFYPSRST